MAINNLSINMKSEKSSAVSRKIVELDKAILNLSLLINVDKVCSEALGEKFTVKSTYEVKTVEELDKICEINKSDKK